MDATWVVPGYRHIRNLGQGAAGQVVLAVHEATGTQVAIKYLSAQLLAEEDFVERFRDEARVLGGIEDPNLVQFHEYVEAPTLGAAIVMEFVEGVSLAELLKTEGATSPEAALVVLKGSLLGLSAAHRVGVVHRDYKPGNVMVRPDGASKLADFGIATRAGENVPSAGTPSYMAPEQWAGHGVTASADVYAATAVFYECLTGEKPYPAKTLPQLAMAHRTAPIPAGNVDGPLRPLVMAGLAKDASARPESASVFLGRLEAIALAAYGVGWEERGRHHLAARVAALLGLLIPLSEGAQQGGTALAVSELTRQVARKSVKRGMIAAAAGAVLLILGGTSAVVIAASGDSPSKPRAQVNVSPTSESPSESPSDTPSETPSSPSKTPTPSPSDTATPTPSPSNTPAGGDDNGNPPDDPPSTKPPTKKPPTKKPTPKPTKPPAPKPFSATSVTVNSVTYDFELDTVTASVSVKGTGEGPVTVNVLFRRSKTSDSGSATVQAKGSATVFVSFDYDGCVNDRITATATAAPGSAPASNAQTVSAFCNVG